MLSDTQIAAWELIQPNLSERRLTVAKCILAAVKGKTLFEIKEELDWPINNVSGRVTELAKQGIIRDSGERRVNPESGKQGIVWIGDLTPRA